MAVTERSGQRTTPELNERMGETKELRPKKKDLREAESE
jgi:hypothetical protein